jgi:crossover junction endodeoxyribonuclease RusA
MSDRFMANVPGIPIPKGSMVGLWSDTSKRVIVKHEQKKLKQWQRDIGWIVKGAMNRPLFLMALADQPVTLELVFYLPAPGDAKPGHPVPWLATPDLDKLVRAVLDALKGILYVDDRQVWSVRAQKRSACPTASPGVTIACEVDRLFHTRTGERPVTRRAKTAGRRTRTRRDHGDVRTGARP